MTKKLIFDEFTQRRIDTKPDFELETLITGVRIGDTGKIAWNILIDDDVDLLLAADMLEDAADVLRAGAENG